MQEERGKHPEQCLMQEEWGMVKEHIRGTEEYRKSLCTKLDDIRKENKERFEILLAQMRSTDGDRLSDHKDSEKRIRNLEHFRWTILGAVAIITSVLIPVALAVIK